LAKLTPDQRVDELRCIQTAGRTNELDRMMTHLRSNLELVFGAAGTFNFHRHSSGIQKHFSSSQAQCKWRRGGAHLAMTVAEQEIAAKFAMIVAWWLAVAGKNRLARDLRTGVHLAITHEHLLTVG
jgi:hypothetical protein